MSTPREARHESTKKYYDQIRLFTEDYKDANLLKKINGRKHTGMKGFQNSTVILNIAALAKKLQGSSKKMDDFRRAKKILNFWIAIYLYIIAYCWWCQKYIRYAV